MIARAMSLLLWLACLLQAPPAAAAVLPVSLQAASAQPATGQPAVGAPPAAAVVNQRAAHRARRRRSRGIRGTSARPQVVHSVQAKFPHELDRVEVDATVVVGMVVDAAGHPTVLHVVKAAEDEEFNAEALRAVGLYRFRPAQRDGKAVAAPFRVTVQFSNHDVDDKQ